MRSLTLLGPQRLEPTLVSEVDRLDLGGPIAVVTAGWQERESEDGELRDHLQREIINLRLHQRSDQLYEEDPELFRAHRSRQDQLRKLQQLYRYRLDFVIEPARELLRRDDDPEILEAEQEAAIASLRTLDRRHLGRIRKINSTFDEAWQPLERPSVRRHRDEIRELLERSLAVVVAGGHVATLLNRLRLFGLAELWVELPIFAWSAGAMALASQIVLFHDSPPQGAGNAEVLEEGLGAFPQILPLPHARRRLRLDDVFRVALFARRFRPMRCVPFDEGTCLTWNGETWHYRPGSRLLQTDGRVGSLEAA